MLVNNSPVSVSADGTFQARYYLPAGPQSFRVVARNSAGVTVEVTRSVVVAYSAAVVNVFVLGGDSWLLATVDGADVPGTGRVYRDGERPRCQGVVRPPRDHEIGDSTFPRFKRGEGACIPSRFRLACTPPAPEALRPAGRRDGAGQSVAKAGASDARS